MAVFSRKYLFDVDVLGHLQFHPDSTRIFQEMVEGIQSGHIRTVRQVSSGEIGLFPDVEAFLKPHKAQFEVATEIQFCPEVRGLMHLFDTLAPKLFQRFSSKNNPDPADPWLITVASVHGFTLVTDENKNAPTRIPMACDQPALKCRCINGPEFFWETGIVQGDYDPHGIRVHDFYSLP